MCTPLVTSEVEHHIIYLLAIWVLFFDKYLFKSFDFYFIALLLIFIYFYFLPLIALDVSALLDICIAILSPTLVVPFLKNLFF